MLAVLMILAVASRPEPPIRVVGHAWAPFISPMGEPFRALTATDDTLARWFGQADRNHDGQITPEEMTADADRFFAALDLDGDGLIEPEELVRYEWELAPDIQLSSRLKRRPGEAVSPDPPGDAATDPEIRRSRRRDADADWLAGGLQGAARYGLLNLPEPVAAADADFDRAISRAEFRRAAIERFQLLDRDRRGTLSLATLESIWTNVLATLKERKHRTPRLDPRVGAPLPPER